MKSFRSLKPAFFFSDSEPIDCYRFDAVIFTMIKVGRAFGLQPKDKEKRTRNVLRKLHWGNQGFSRSVKRRRSINVTVLFVI